MANDQKMMHELAERLQRAIHSGLPGAAAHQQMAPVTRTVMPVNPADFPQAKTAAVMILLLPMHAVPTITLIERPAYEGVHGGQVSFPGGKMEERDTDLLSTALRETREEIGVTDEIHLIGQLSNVYIPPSNFFVYPFVGYLTASTAYHPDPREVRKVFNLPIDHLLDPAAKGTVPINRPDISFDAPCYRFEQYRIWGATAIMLSELEWLLKTP